MAPKDLTDVPNHILDDSSRSSSSTEGQNIYARKQLNVSFSAHCQIRSYPKASTKAHSRAWYTEADYIEFRSLAKEISEATECGKTIDGEDMSTGSMSRNLSLHRVQRRLDMWDAVLNAQRNGRSPEAIAAECENLTRKSARESELSALLLAVEVRRMKVCRPVCSSAKSIRSEPSQDAIRPVVMVSSAV